MNQKAETIPYKIKKESRRASFLLLYLITWFLSLAFLSNEVFKGSNGLHIGYGFALVKALLVTKFMILSQNLFPFARIRKKKLFAIIALRSIVYAFFVLFLTILEKGLENFIASHSFLGPMINFCIQKPLHILAWTVIYWLITVPYLTIEGLKDILGKELIYKALFKMR
jgi:hypothetical protein